MLAYWDGGSDAVPYLSAPSAAPFGVEHRKAEDGLERMGARSEAWRQRCFFGAAL